MGAYRPAGPLPRRPRATCATIATILTKESGYLLMIFETEKGALFGKEFAKKPACPFCGLPVERPADLKTRRYGEMPVGSCACGAVYACDASGRNLGSAFIEALVFGCDMDWDLAWNLLPGEDYTDKLVDRYDSVSHLIVPTGFYQGRRVSGALYFIRLHREIREVTWRGVQHRLEQARAAAAPPGPPVGAVPEKGLTRKEVEDLVAGYRPEPIIAAAALNKKIIRELRRLLYSGDELFRNRTSDIMGQVSAVIARRDPGAVSTLLQGLINSAAAPGTSSWGSLEAAGEIIGRSPHLFAGYIPLLFNFLGDRDHRSRALRAITRAAQSRPDLVRGAAFRLLPFLRDPDPGTRGHAAVLFGNLGMWEAVKDLESIKDDASEIKIYMDGIIEKTTVGRLAGEALDKLAGTNCRSADKTFTFCLPSPDR